MKKLCSIILILLVCFALFSCSNLYQDYSTAASTTVLIPAESICRARNALSTSDLYISVCLEMDGSKRIIEQNKKISDEYATKGMTFTFEKLPVGKNGTISVAVGTDQTFSDNFSVKKISTLDGESRFTVKKKNNLIKVEISTSTVYHGEFETFSEIDESYKRVTITFTESSTINAPLPVGTTNWAISHNGNLYGRFGEIIDFKNQLMNYKTYFPEQEYEQQVPIKFVPTGESPENIKTPIVYSSFDSTSNPNSPYLYNFANSLNEVGENPKLLFNSSELTDYCFDNAGNLYVVYEDSVYKIAYDNKTGKYEEFIGNDETALYGTFATEAQDYGIQSLAYDAGENVLYVLTSSYIYKYPNPAGTIYKNFADTFDRISLTNNENLIDFTSWTVHDGIIYVSTVDNENGTCYTLNLNSYEITEEQLTLSSEKSIEIISDINAWLSNTTDLIYQDGNIYIIFKSYNISWTPDSNGVSIGGILKYNIADESFEKKGLITENKTIKVGINNTEISYLAPTDDDEDFYFYGPTKFVAIIPKKLVFLDQGASIDDYAYNPNNNNIPTKTRIVEYDLSTNTFSSKEITGTDLGFNFSF